jgi:hypothetical protein
VRFILLFIFALPILDALPTSAQSCRVIHGRAILYTGDGQARIWHIGTHHEFSFDYNDPLISKYLAEDGSKALYADFTICPLENYVRGAAQAVVVKNIKNLRVTTRKDWTE